MKKTLIAFAVLGAFAASASAQSSITIYGIVDAAAVYKTNQTASGGTASMDAGQMATSRWGFKGTEDLGAGMKANFNLEGTLANDTGAAGGTFGAAASSTLFDRSAWVGLSGDFGTATLGRQTSLITDVVGQADPLSFAHAGSNPNVMITAHHSGTFFGGYGTNGGGASSRQNNSVKYLSPTLSGFSGALMYGFGEKAGDTSANTYKGLSGNFAEGAFAAGINYSEETDAAGTATQTSWTGGGKFKLNTVTFKLIYSENEVDTTKRKFAVLSAGVDFALSPAVTLTGAYYNVKRSGDAVAGVSQAGKADQYIGMAKYAFSKRTTAYASLTHAKAGSVKAQDVALALGIIGAGQESANRVAVGVLHAF